MIISCKRKDFPQYIQLRLSAVANKIISVMEKIKQNQQSLKNHRFQEQKQIVQQLGCKTVDRLCASMFLLRYNYRVISTMKWSQFVVQEGEAITHNSPISHLNVSRSNSSLSLQKRFTLKSLEKVGLNVSKYEAKRSRLREEESSGDQLSKKMMRKVSFMSNNISRDRDENSFVRNSFTNIDKEAQILGQVCEAFLREFQTFIDTFFSKQHEPKLKIIHQQTIQNKILQGIQDSLTSFFKAKQNLIFKRDSPVRKTAVHTKKSGVSSQQSPSLQKKFSRALQFKNQKIIQKDLYNQDQKQKSELQKMLQKMKKGETDMKKKFTRKGSRSKRDNSQNASVEQIIERSFNDSQRSSRNKLQAREAIYKFNQVFSQNNQV